MTNTRQAQAKYKYKIRQVQTDRPNLLRLALLHDEVLVKKKVKQGQEQG
jgi:hypothetical protein